MWGKVEEANNTIFLECTELQNKMNIYTYIYIYICMITHIYIYIYIKTNVLKPIACSVYHGGWICLNLVAIRH